MEEGNKEREVPAIEIITLEELDHRRGGPASEKPGWGGNCWGLREAEPRMRDEDRIPVGSNVLFSMMA